MNLQDNFDALIEENRTAWEIKKQSIEDSMARLNGSKTPTYDRYGRMHAPHDGYIFCDRFGHEETYRGGQYLPIDLLGNDIVALGFYPKKNWKQKRKIKASGEAREVLLNLDIAFLEIKSGTTWDTPEGLTSYLYIKAFDSGVTTMILKSIIEYAGALETAKKLKQEEEKARLKALKADAPEGKVSVKAKLVFTKWAYSDNYYNDPGTLKGMWELEDKSTIWGTVPKKAIDVEVGDVVEFIATFRRAQNDSTHAFYSRPSKVKIIEGVV